MLTALSIRDIVLVDRLDLEVGPGLTVLTGETGAGKSIILDALGLALGTRADSGLVRAGAAQAVATAVFDVPADPAWLAAAAERGLDVMAGGELILRRVLGVDGRSRAFINDQAVGVTALKALAQGLVEVHGQHETVGLLDSRTHQAALDAYGGLDTDRAAVVRAHEARREAQRRLEDLRSEAAGAAARTEELTLALQDLDALDPRTGEEAELAGERALLGAAEKALSDLTEARDAIGGDKLSQRLSSALRAVEHARARALQAVRLEAQGSETAGHDHPVVIRLAAAAEAIDRTLVEAMEAVAQLDQAADALDVEPGRLDRAEERLFSLRAAARKLNTTVEELPRLRLRLREQLRLVEDGAEALVAAERAVTAARADYDERAGVLSRGRAAAAARLVEAVMSELGPLKLERARFRVALDPLDEDRRGARGGESVRFEIATNPGLPFGPLDTVASGGELARFALAMKAALAGRPGAEPPVMIFDEVDQGVGGAVAEAVGLRLERLSASGQVLVVTHSPQVAARGRTHWKVRKSLREGTTLTTVETLDAALRDEEIARMLSGAVVTDEARAAARALIGAPDGRRIATV